MPLSTGKCGCECFNCPSYKENLKTIDDRVSCSAGWKKFLNINISPEKLRECDGCSVPDSQRRNYYINCIVRKCAMINGIPNCAYCTGFLCSELQNLHSLQKINSRQEYTEVYDKKISNREYKQFVKPYTGFHRLAKIRKKLTLDDLKEFKRFSSNTKFSLLKGPQPKGIKLIYTLLTTISIVNNVSYARLQTAEKKREQLIKLLWTVGRYGNVTGENILELEGFTYLTQKNNGSYHLLLENIDVLKRHNIHCKIVSLVNNKWLTPGGALRKNGWKINMQFGKSTYGKRMPILFKYYTEKLVEKFEHNAYSKFRKAEIPGSFITLKPLRQKRLSKNIKSATLKK